MCCLSAMRTCRRYSFLSVFTVVYICMTVMFLAYSNKSLSTSMSALSLTDEGSDFGAVVQPDFSRQRRKQKNLNAMNKTSLELFVGSTSASADLDTIEFLLRKYHEDRTPVVMTANEFRLNPNSLTGNPLIDAYGENDCLLTGEGGRGVIFFGEEKKRSEQLLEKWHVNVMASDVIPLNRKVADSRPEGCSHVTFPSDLPSTSVIIPFHDEWPSVLLRTVYSVINRTPRHLLQEVVLVDDNSTLAALREPLDEYIRDFFPKGLVRLVRMRERAGLIRSRMKGLEHSQGEVVVFLDSHIEVNTDWLQPLLVEIRANRQTLAMATLDYIDSKTLGYDYSRERVARYGFDWRLFFFEVYFRPDQEVANKVAPRPGVITVGTAFAMDRKYFEELGGYDVGMRIWGGENIELSWRVWMCGGRLLHVPCSHVGHMARTQPYSFGPAGRHMTTMFNYKRAAEVWMGPHKKFVYENFPEMDAIDVGDLRERKAVQKRLGCQNFTWYLDNIWPELTVYDRDVIAWGSLYNRATSHCLDNHAFMGGPPQVYAEICHYRLNTQGFSLTLGGHLRTTLQCAVVKGTGLWARPMLEFCPSSDTWKHTQDGALVHVQSKLCLDEDLQGPVLSPCNPSVTSQKWTFTKYIEHL